jgi:hypothetical protein
MNIIEKEDIFEIKDLQVTIDEYVIYINSIHLLPWFKTVYKKEIDDHSWVIPYQKTLKEVILQKMSILQNEFVIKDKNEEIFRLKDHNKKLLTQIKKSKDRKQFVWKLEQENQDLEKDLSEKNEENSRLKNLNQGLLEQIRKLKEEKLKNPDIKDITNKK